MMMCAVFVGWPPEIYNLNCSFCAPDDFGFSREVEDFCWSALALRWTLSKERCHQLHGLLNPNFARGFPVTSHDRAFFAGQA